MRFGATHFTDRPFTFYLIGFRELILRNRSGFTFPTVRVRVYETLLLFALQFILLMICIAICALISLLSVIAVCGLGGGREKTLKLRPFEFFAVF